MLVRRLLLFLPLLKTVLLQQHFTSKDNELVGCVRHTQYHYVVRDNYTLHHLNDFNSLTQRLLAANSISNLTAMVVGNTLRSATHNLCKLDDLPNRIRRQVLAAALAGIVGGLSLPAIVSAIINPTNSNSLSPEYRNFIEKTRSLTRRNSQLLFSLQRRMDKLEKKEEANELIVTILQALKTEEKKFLELSQGKWRYSTMLYGLLKAPMKHYSKLGMFNLSPGTHQLDEPLPLPERAFHLNVSTTSAESCENARIDITLYAPLPSQVCETVVYAGEDYIMTQIEGPKKECRVMPPLFKLIELPDGSMLAPYNSYITAGCEVGNFSFSFNEESSTFFAVPKTKGAIVSSCGGVRRSLIDGGRGVSPALGCSSWLSSGHLTPSVHDLYSSSAWILNMRGEYIDPAPLAGSDFLFLDQIYDTSTSGPSTTPTSSEPEKVDSLATGSWASLGRDTAIVSLTTLLVVTGLSLGAWIYKRSHGRSGRYRPHHHQKRRFSRSDIEVLPRLSAASVDGKLDQLATLQSKLSTITKPPLNSASCTAYSVELAPMPPLNNEPLSEAQSCSSFSFSSSDTVHVVPAASSEVDPLSTGL